MLNTCSIGRRWKSREGWSRPVLTGERGTLFPTLAGRVSSCGGFLVGWQGTLFLVVAMTMLVRRLICLRPLSGSRTATTGIGRVAGFGSAGRRFSGWPSCIGFAVVMAQVRRPVPFRTRKLRPGTAMVLHSRGCGRVARRRIQLSGPSGRVPWGIPGRSLSYFPWGFPSGATPRKPPFCFSSGFFRAFTDLPATPFRLVEGVFPRRASLSFLRTSRPGIHDSPKGSSPIRGLPADAGRGRPVFLS